jgi:Uma2 family endonuclease
MTSEEFLDWAQAQSERYEFDGVRPVGMTGGTVNHNRISLNLHRTLFGRLRDGPCEPLGPDAGIATTGDAVRYPDALVTCARPPGDARLVPGVVVVFEVPSPISGRTDRIDKLREYRAVHSILRYVIVEHTGIGISVFARATGVDEWQATGLTPEDVLRMPEIGIEIPVAELYDRVEFPRPSTESAAEGD